MLNIRKPCPKCGRDMAIKNITPTGYEWECSCGHLNKKQKFTKTKIEEARSNLYYAVLTDSPDKEKYREELDMLKKQLNTEETQNAADI